MSNREQTPEYARDANAAHEASSSSLTNDLRRLRRLAVDLDAPPQLEATLRAAFRAHAAKQVDAQPASQIVMPRRAFAIDKEPRAPAARVASRGRASVARTNSASHRASGVAAVICAIVIVTAASLADFTRRAPLTDKQAQAPMMNAPATVGATNTTTLASIYREAQIEAASDNIVSTPATQPEQVKPAEAEATPQAASAYAARFAYSNRTGRTRITPANAPTVARETYAAAAAPAELATEFLPLLEAGSLAAIESGHVVRVRLPRSSLVALGLPMNQDRASESVTADVLLGEDGVARAIRFVR